MSGQKLVMLAGLVAVALLLIVHVFATVARIIKFGVSGAEQVHMKVFGFIFTSHLCPDTITRCTLPFTVQFAPCVVVMHLLVEP